MNDTGGRHWRVLGASVDVDVGDGPMPPVVRRYRGSHQRIDEFEPAGRGARPLNSGGGPP